jgi:hypothetical protein
MNAFAAWLGTLDWGKVNRPWFRAALFLLNDRGSRSTQTNSGIQAFVASPEDGSTLKFDRHGGRKPDPNRAIFREPLRARWLEVRCEFQDRRRQRCYAVRGQSRPDSSETCSISKDWTRSTSQVDDR